MQCFFLYAVLAFLSLKPEFDFIHLPFVPDTLTLIIILTASIFRYLRLEFFFCVISSLQGTYLLSLHFIHSFCRHMQKQAAAQNIHLLSLIPAGVYLLHAGWIKIRK